MKPVDATVDVDAAPPNTPVPDAEAGPDGWTHVPDLPSGCHAYVSWEREIVGNYEWQPCFDRRPECRELVVDWGDWQEEGVFRPSHTQAVHDGVHGYFGFGRVLFGGHWQFTVVRSDGRGIVATRFNSARTHCHLNDLAIGEDGLLVSLFPGDAFPPLRFGLIWARFTPGAMRTMPLGESLLGPGGALQRLAVNAQVAAAELTGANAMLIVRDGAARIVRSTEPGQMRTPFTAGTDVYCRIWDSAIGQRIHVITMDDVARPLLEYPDRDVIMFATTEDRMAWVEAHGDSSASEYDRREIWVAPRVASRSGLRPRMLHDMGPGGYTVEALRIDGGWVGALDTAMDEREILLVHIADGTVRKLKAPDGYSWRGSPLWITEEEVAAVVADGRFPRTLFRVAISSLPTE